MHLVHILDSELNYLRGVLTSYDYIEYNEHQINKLDGKQILTETTTLGLFFDEYKTIGIIHRGTRTEILPVNIQDIVKNSVKIESIYEGSELLLIKTESNIYSFNIKLYNEIQEIISTLNYEIPTDIEAIMINPIRSTIIIKSGWLDFILSGLSKKNPQNEERLYLSKKIEEAKPFFEFDIPILINWNQLIDAKDSTFEKLTEKLLICENSIKSIVPIGKTRAADRGRDFIIKEVIDTLNGKFEIKWLIQCKYSKNSINVKHINGWVERTIEHKCNGFWLITNNDLTPDVIDQLNDVESNPKYHIKTRFWQRVDFDVKLNLNPGIVDLFFNKVK